MFVTRVGTGTGTGTWDSGGLASAMTSSGRVGPHAEAPHAPWARLTRGPEEARTEVEVEVVGRVEDRRWPIGFRAVTW